MIIESGIGFLESKSDFKKSKKAMKNKKGIGYKGKVAVG